ncbi:MAG: hypothetical protein ACTSRU_15330 [Candidatus Hodarchaeales archaeon]
MVEKEKSEPFRLIWDGTEFTFLPTGQYNENEMTTILVNEEGGYIKVNYGSSDTKISLIERRMIERRVRNMARAGFPHPVTRKRIYPGLEILIDEDMAEVDIRPSGAGVPPTVVRREPRPEPREDKRTVISTPAYDKPAYEPVKAAEASIKAVEPVKKRKISDMGSLTVYELAEILESTLEKNQVAMVSRDAEGGYRFAVLKSETKDSFRFDLRKSPR